MGGICGVRQREEDVRESGGAQGAEDDTKVVSGLRDGEGVGGGGVGGKTKALLRYAFHVKPRGAVCATMLSNLLPASMPKVIAMYVCVRAVVCRFKRQSLQDKDT